jgi:hypothetical protein
MATGVRSWSQTAASNSTADASVNWAEGMLPSLVNDSARATMASVAKWRDDLAGMTSTAGTSTAFTLVSNQGLALTQGVVAGFYPHTTNNSTCTINIDSLGAKPLRPAPNVEFLAGALAAGTPYQATYFSSNSGEWIVQGVSGLYSQGTFTPAVKFGGASTGLTYTTQLGSYIKIGKLITFWINIVINDNGSSTGTATITGLPFTSATVRAPLIVSGYGFGPTISDLGGNIAAGGTTIGLFGSNDFGDVLDNSNIIDATELYVSGSYISST